jgi:hypothetical protein
MRRRKFETSQRKAIVARLSFGVRKSQVSNCPAGGTYCVGVGAPPSASCPGCDLVLGLPLLGMLGAIPIEILEVA